MSDERLADVEKRLTTIEAAFKEVQVDVHKIKNSQQETVAEMTTLKSQVTTLITNTDHILSFVDGGKKVFGFAKKHWKTAITFGAGIMTAAGIGNPEVLKYITTFFAVAT